LTFKQVDTDSQDAFALSDSKSDKLPPFKPPKTPYNLYDSDSDDVSDTERILLERRRKNDEWMEQIEKERKIKEEEEMGKRRALEEEERQKREEDERRREEACRKKRERDEKRSKEKERKEAEKKQKALEREEKKRLKEEAKIQRSPPRVPEIMGEIDDDDEGKLILRVWTLIIYQTRAETKSACEEKTLEELEAERDALLQQVRNPEPPLDHLDIDNMDLSERLRVRYFCFSHLKRHFLNRSNCRWAENCRN